MAVDSFNGGTCATCIFWHSVDECRRFPPQIVGPNQKVKWPSAVAGDWCGEYVQVGEAGMRQGPD